MSGKCRIVSPLGFLEFPRLVFSSPPPPSMLCYPISLSGGLTIWASIKTSSFSRLTKERRYLMWDAQIPAPTPAALNFQSGLKYTRRFHTQKNHMRGKNTKDPRQPPISPLYQIMSPPRLWRPILNKKVRCVSRVIFVVRRVG